MPTTIQTIKEAEEKIPHTKECIQANKELGEKFGMEFGKKCMCDRPKKISELHQTLLAVFESELERHKRQKAIHKEIIATHDIAPFKWHEGRIAEAEDNIFHLTEVINYLKQK